ncbi:MAG: hypothetical protein HYS18_10970 [Burkholderiales bacterium]|nr:hypothetical protein [Burkholderiales bacterium]
MIDAREFNFYAPRISGLPRKCMDYSPFRYLRLLLPIPFVAWYASGEALHRLETQWVRAHPASKQTFAEACHAMPDASCAVDVRVIVTHELALATLISIALVIMLMVSMPRWPSPWQERGLKNAAPLLGIGLLFTLQAGMTNGVLMTLTAWLVPTVWWNSPGIGLQLALTVGLFAFLRFSSQAKLAWRLFRRFVRRRTGREAGAAECTALWQLIESECRRLQIAKPTHLVLGVFPDCRLVVGKMTIDPAERQIEGRILYLGATLVNALLEEELRLVVRYALTRNCGRLGHWLPAVEDWLEAKQRYLDECKYLREVRMTNGAGDAALAFCDEWLTAVRRSLPGFQAEHAYAQTVDRQQQAEEEAIQAQTILSDAALAYRKDVFHLLIVNLGSGMACPPVFAWFGRAFAHQHLQHVPKNASVFASPTLNQELVLLEKEWLIKTAQASTPTDCWELRSA